MNKEKALGNKRNKILILLGILLFCCFSCIALSMYGNSLPKTETTTPKQEIPNKVSNTNPVPPSTTENDPSIIIPVVFLGNHTWSEIQPKLNKILLASGEQNPTGKYLNVANALLELRKSSTRKDITEMMILDRAIQYYDALSSNEGKFTIPEALSFAVLELEIEAH